MSLTQIAVLLVGFWLVLVSQIAVSSVLTLIFGIAVILLVVFDSPYVRRGVYRGP